MELNVADFERVARERLDPGVFDYFAGGAGDEQTLAANVSRLAAIKLRPRVLVDVASVDTGTTVLGTDISMPILVAPVALQGLVDADGELATARAAAAAGTVFTLSTIATTHPRALAQIDGPRWMQLYVFRDRAITQAIVDEAVACGYCAIALTVDAPRAGRRERDLRANFHIPPELAVPAVAAAFGAGASPTVSEILDLLDRTLSWADVERLAAHSPLPVILKGVQTPEDARLACEHGVAGIVVSNHGGRQLDGVAASIDLLPTIVDAVDGRIEVLMDGGIRRGTDALKALALGARAVLCGRAVLWGLAAGGEQGVTRVLELLRDELELGMALLGAPRVGDVSRAHVSI